ncbi:dienelactone hydrolase family protein [Iamia majanohamensis]|uniref:Dienelactone hydrolase family protein n=1 Tax=Iamia majanohamensis TaxID=467976 RepID=A0AAE9YIB5_9ACTN|nr:alpha/beta fold hydrolase [Iamia majanohamensis]WCO69047.1 dienelactone hydrolase family protein [Iamia majanohamensis]
MEERRTHAGTAYVVAPDGGEGPGVLVLHAWWGLTPFFRSVADRLADAGFVALAPDLFAGETADTPDEAKALLDRTDATGMVELVRSSVDVLAGLPITPDGPVGVVGFSMGASLGLWAAAHVPDRVGAVSAFYGTTDVDFAPVRAAVQAHVAEFDDLGSEDDVVEMEAHMRLVGLEPDIHRYPGTAHWFFEEDRTVAHSPAAAALAWDRTVTFLHAHLGGTDAGGG